MITSALIKDLDKRYDGPVPIGASYPSDYNLSWSQQCSNRENWARSEVHRIKKEIALLTNKGQQSQDICSSIHEHKLRRKIHFAEQNWATFRKLSGKDIREDLLTSD